VSQIDPVFSQCSPVLQIDTLLYNPVLFVSLHSEWYQTMCAVDTLRLLPRWYLLGEICVPRRNKLSDVNHYFDLCPITVAAAPFAVQINTCTK